MVVMGLTNQKATIILLIIITIIFSFPVYSASCTPSSARICVGADDDAYVWINGNPVDDGTHFHAVTDCPNVPCANVPIEYINAAGNNVISIQNNNLITGFVWASWVLDITCFDGSHFYMTSADSGIAYYNQPLGYPTPSNDVSGRAWYHPDYSGAGTWGTPVTVTDPAAFFDCPATDPRTGNYARMLSYSDSAGANPGDPNQSPAGHVLYFRQSFSFLKPVSITKTINKTSFFLNETVTYCFNYLNPENVARTFEIWDTIPAVTNFIGCNGGCGVTTYGSNVVVNWNINVGANASGTVCMWLLAARYPYLNKMEIFTFRNNVYGMDRGGRQ
ncbi:MAG: hypothetical protein KA120_08245 [Candidatus Goldbacteria bacterium]|nr:hypothetical protein [Candidatus Goldiibacteriota bacterium]